MKTIKYQAYWFDTDHTIGDKGQFPGGDQRRVQVDGKTVGFLRVTKEGWAQSNKKRGTPSQIWKFEPVRTSDIGVLIAQKMPSYTEYFAEAKKIISASVNNIRETPYI
jgi:hypothetical protein